MALEVARQSNYSPPPSLRHHSSFFFCLPPQRPPPSSLRRHSSFVTRDVFLPVLSAITPVLCSVRCRPALLTPPTYLNDHTLLSYHNVHCILAMTLLDSTPWCCIAGEWVLCSLLCAAALSRGDPEKQQILYPTHTPVMHNLKGRLESQNTSYVNSSTSQ